MNFIKRKPPVCKGCLFPPDPQRRLLMFETVSSMMEFVNSRVVDSDEVIESWEGSEEKGFLMDCPKWGCQTGSVVDSIESLMRNFDWDPKELEPDSEEYRKRLQAANIKKAVEDTLVLKAFLSGDKIE